MKNVVIFDCNGIFMKSEVGFVKRFCDYFELPEEELLPVYMEIMNNVRRPDAPNIYDLWKPYFDAWGIEMDSDQLNEFWFDPEIHVPEMLELLKQLVSEGNQGIILSNNFRERHDFKIDFFDQLNDAATTSYYSWNTGFVKPHKDSFNLVFAANNISPDQCIFFDDSPINVAAADEVGMAAHLFTNEVECREILNGYGLLL